MCVVLVSKDSLTSEIKFLLKHVQVFVEIFQIFLDRGVGGVNCIQTFIYFSFIYKVPKPTTHF